MALLDGITQGISGGIQLADYLTGVFEKHKSGKLSAANYLRSCYFETRNNLELLETIDFDKLKEEEKWSPAYIAIINALETDCAACLLLAGDGDLNVSLYDFLKKYGRIQPEKLDEKTQQEARLWKYETIEDPLFFVIAKTTLLKKLRALSPNLEDILRNLKLAKRIENIQTRLCLIEKHTEILLEKV